MPLKKYIRCISTIVLMMLLPWNIILCCGPTLGKDEERFLLFNSAIDGAFGLKALTYSNNLFDASAAEKQPDFKRNCNEWKKYSSNKVNEKDIFEIQYKTPPQLFLNAYKLKNWGFFKQNTFIGWLVRKENQAALDYMALAKQAEAVDILNIDPWDTTVESKKQAVLALANLNYKRIATTPEYLQQRYAFQQAIKLWFYVGTDDNTIIEKLQQVYLNHLEGRNTIVAAWAKIYFAMVQKDPNQKTLYLLKAFDESDEKKQFSFLRIVKKDLSALETVTKNTYTNSLANAMFAMKTNGKALESIKRVSNLNPGSKFLPALIGKEINKLESWLSTPQLLGFYDDYREESGSYQTKIQRQLLEKKDAAYLAQVVEFLTNFNNRYPRPAMQLALVHLYNMQQNHKAASRLLSQLPVYRNTKSQTQKLIEQVIVTAHLEDIKQQAVKEKLAIYMNHLLQLNPPFKKRLNKEIYDRWNDEDAERSDDISELLLILSRAYKKKGDLLTSGLLYTKANITTNTYDGWFNGEVSYSHIAWYDRYATPSTIDSLLALKHTVKKTAFEKLLTPSQWAKEDMYKDLKGTILFRQQQYDKALEEFKSMHRNFWKDNYEYKDYLPLTPITYTGIIPNTSINKAGYPIASKLLITQDVVNVIRSIKNSKNNEVRAAAYFNLGNVQFNTSYHGKAWMMFSYGKSLSEPVASNEFPDFLWGFYNFWPNDLKYGDNYYMCKSASDNYAKGFALSANKELKAKCLLGLLTCQRFSNFLRTGNEKLPYKKGNNPSPYLQEFKNYQNTNTFKQAAVHCPDIKEYLKN